ncbi:pyridoxamine kinase [Streptococcus gallinaceus]|uniref:pyridoxal kinase n=1 Tax=Streptococcus gallinaceus TaxID=165758 RepID=A0ABV2JJB1_9STRE|nr:pyridoxamine kinase [Streptococcus gallinaceus]MCP1639032.1 pyridoxine kinase [Streptococcus gallinaceus]MCP1769724.1 pyridoxine kinase [Streptococcus gallinaceus]
MTKRLLVANDLPGIGKVALAASLPILAACQIETAILPTVLLSSHTGGFPAVAVADMAWLVKDYLTQWQQLELTLDGLLIGYCRSAELLEQLQVYAQHENVPIILDPVLGDKGKLYTGFDQDYVASMRQVARQSTILLPNLTEAALLTDSAYLGEDYGRDEIEHLLRKLADFGCQHVILTGVSFDESEIGLAYYDVRQDKISYHMTRQLPYHFFGTGDIVAILVAAIVVENLAFETALPEVLDFLEASLVSTSQLARDVKYGVYFEPHLAKLSQQFEQLRNKG